MSQRFGEVTVSGVLGPSYGQGNNLKLTMLLSIAPNRSVRCFGALLGTKEGLS